MSLSAACALAPNLNYRQRDPDAEAAALDRLAIWAGRYTPSVSLQPPSGLLLEVEGSLALLGAIKRILESIRHDLAEMGYTCMLGCAPTASAAWLLARGGSRKIVPSKRMIASEISPLPIAALDCSHKTLETLRAVGVQSIGGLLKLPRDGVARRFGQDLLDQIDRAMGKLPEARRFHIPPSSFAAELELGADVTHVEALLFAAKRLLIQMAGYLSSRCAGIHRYTLTLAHEGAPPTRMQIELVAPTREAAQFITLVRDRLAASALIAPVHAMRIEAGEILALAGDTRDLFQEQTGVSGDWETLVNRLCARLGKHAVQGLSPRAEHRPEHAWRAMPPGARAGTAPRAPRPLWLLEQPRPLKEAASRPHYQDGPLALIAGPERIESGWWDGADIKRDYFIAETTTHSTLWIYRERLQAGGWYLHGIFG